ncbi:MAG: phage tail protein [Firmicutes bacterium HGW-Firmicutes-8]|nr:MAG: phage tail protein [Firmicutes bacterium HGW-Firmicutes-8]
MEPFLGQIELFPYGFAPSEWAPCDGRLLLINQNQALFSLLGFKFGGDGTTTFGLPDLRNAAIGQYNQYYIALQGIYPSRD